ncbi:MAG: 4Fe-4S dicluster domain-containing protein, partial [Desulfocucumaceae bacterium]
AMRLPRRKNCHAFVTLTRAGLKIGPVFVPGLEGTGAYLIALILLLKGYSVRGVMGLDMPSNWMSLHWGLSLENSRAIINRNRYRALWFIDRILSEGHFYGGIIPLLLGLMLLPVSLLYLFVGRFFLAKIFFATDRCTGCGLCVENCLTGSLKMSGKKKRRPYWTFTCESCMRCMAYCPVKAVEAGHSFGVIIYFLTAIPVADYLLNQLTGMLPVLSCVYNDWTVILVQYPFFLLSIFLIYLLFTVLIRISLFNRLFTYTTLTHIYRRYHEPDTRLKDFRG